jgi:hypothetical protein
MTSVVDSAAEAVELRALGCVAARALGASAGVARLFSTVRGAWYLAAGEEILWAVAGELLPHPRAVLLARPLPSDWRGGALAASALRPWWPSLPDTIDDGEMALTSRANALVPRVLAATAPRGLGALLARADPPYPLAAAGPAAAVLVDRLHRGGEFAPAALALIGLGPGLTPSGDDFLVGLCFAAHLRARVGEAARARLDALSAAISALAPGRTNRISASFLADAAAGLGLAALHALSDALAAGSPDPLPAALRLATIGHSSGWDMLAGFLAGLGAIPRG